MPRRQTDFIGQSDRFEQFVEMSRGFNGLAGFPIDCGRNETIYADFHMHRIRIFCILL